MSPGPSAVNCEYQPGFVLYSTDHLLGEVTVFNKVSLAFAVKIVCTNNTLFVQCLLHIYFVLTLVMPPTFWF